MTLRSRPASSIRASDAESASPVAPGAIDISVGPTSVQTRRSGHCPVRRARASMDDMTAIEPLATDELQELAHRHLLMHFTRNGAFGPGGNRLLVLERGEGAYVFDTDGRRYLDGLSSLFCCQLGYSFGEEMAAVGGRAALHARLQHQLGHRAPAGDPARRGAGRARARRPQPRVLHLRRLGVGRGGVEDRPPALPGQGRAAAHEGDRARDRLPRRHARRAVVHRRAADEGAVRRPRRSRSCASPTPTVPPRARERPGRPLRPAARRDGAHDRRDRPGDGGDDHRRAGAERRRGARAARGLLGRAARDRRQATASRWWPTR